MIDAFSITGALELYYSCGLLATTRFVSCLGSPLVICKVSFRSPWGAEYECEKPSWSIIWSQKWLTDHFFSSILMKRDNTCYRGTVNLRLHIYLSRQFQGYILLSTRKANDGTHSKQQTSTPRKAGAVCTYLGTNETYSISSLTVESFLQLLWCLCFQ